nr:hypothetical protein [Vicinamibacteria bacterium]
EFKHCDATRLEIAGRAFARSQIAVWDVMAVLPKEMPPLDGVLALDVFERQPFTLDLASGTLTLESPASTKERTQGARMVKARIATGLSERNSLCSSMEGSTSRAGSSSIRAISISFRRRPTWCARPAR